MTISKTTAPRSTQPVAAYLRVSTADQKHDSQRAELEQWLDRQGIDLAKVAWYVDTETGRTITRTHFDRLQRDIDAGLRRTVVVYKLDRVARDMLSGLEVLGRWCRAGVRVASVTQHIDVSGTVGKIVAAVLLGVAELEWTDRKERQAAGIRLAKRAGVYQGRKPGTTKGKPARARELRDKGMLAPEIAAALKISPRTVFRYLQASPPD
jgi:DNA invertase Pin-like site-specific DNA recombinase